MSNVFNDLNFLTLIFRIRNQQLARIQCRICDEKWSTSNVTGQFFQVVFNFVTKSLELTANVDVYNEWIDCCEAENQAELNKEDEENLNEFIV